MLTRFLFAFAALGILAALLLLAVNAYLSRASLWSPLTLDLPSESGLSVADGFVSLEGGVFEIEIELPMEELPGPDVDVMAYTDGPAKVALDWQVHRNGEPVASGDASTPLYWDRRSRSPWSNIRSVIFASPLLADRSAGALFGVLGKSSLVVGIGRFTTQPGEEYRLEATVRSTGPVAEKTEPFLRVRARRQVWSRERSRSMAFAHAGKYVLGGALLALGCGFVLVLMNRRRRT